MSHIPTTITLHRESRGRLAAQGYKRRTAQPADT